MKKYLLSLFLIITAAFGYAQSKPFTIKGTVKGLSKGMLMLSYPQANEKYVSDSAIVKNGSFEFKGFTDGPVMAYLYSSTASKTMNDPNTTTFFLEPGNLNMTLTAGDFANLKLTGSKSQDDYVLAQSLKKSQTDRMKKLSVAYDEANNAYIAARKAKKPEAEQEVLKEKAGEIREKMEPISEEMNKIDLQFIKTHPDSYYSASALRWKVSSLPLAEGKALYTGLSARVRNSADGKNIAKEIQTLEGGSPGAKANLFTATDINGELLNLADYKGKSYLLLDFWASWCVPCRKGNPHLLSLYEKYKAKGLEIVGVSDDDNNTAAWKAAVNQDKIGVWKHVLRGLKRTENDFDRSADLSNAYAIHTLPTKILIDKDGVIIGRYGGGGEEDEDALDKKLEQIFK